MSVLDRFLEVMDDKQAFLKKLNGLSSKKTLILQSILWDYVMKLGLKKNPNFKRSDITEKLEKSETYQKRVGCTLPNSYCRGKICVFSNPECATRKIKGVIYILRQIYLQLNTTTNKKV